MLRIIPKDEGQLSLLREMEEMPEVICDQEKNAYLSGVKHSILSHIVVFSYQIDIWRGVTQVGIPVDIRVPFLQLSSVQVHLQKHNLEHSTMIEDLQVQIQEEPKSPNLETTSLVFSCSCSLVAKG